MPKLLDRIAQLVDSESQAPQSDAGAKTDEAEIHAYQRLREGYSLEEVHAEYAVLRRCLLRVIDEAPARLYDGEIEILGATLDGAIAVAVESFTEARERVLRALERVSALAHTGLTTLDSLIAEFLRAVLETEAIDSAAVLLREGDHLRVRAVQGFEREVSDEVTLPVGAGFAGTIATTRAPLSWCVADLEKTERDAIVAASGARAVYGTPMIAGDRLIGVVQVGSRVASSFAEDDRKLFQAVAARLADVVAEAQRLSREEAAGVAARVFAAANSVDDAARALLRALGDAFGWAVGAYWKVDSETDKLRLVDIWARDRERHSRFIEESRRLDFARGEGLPGSAWSSGTAECRRDVVHDPKFPRASLAAAEGLHGGVAFPLKVGDAVLGVIELFSHEPRGPAEHEVFTTHVVTEHLGEFVRRLLAQDALVRSEREKAALIESALDAIVGMDAKGRVVAWNPASESTFGYSREEALGREMAELIIPERLRAAHRRGLARYLETGEEHYLGRRLEFAALRKDGSEITVEIVIVQLSLPGATPIFNAFVRDITERKRAAETTGVLADATRVLVSSLDQRRLIEEFASVVVPRLADHCMIDLMPEGAPSVWTVANREPELDALMRRLRDRYPMPEAHPVRAVVASGKPLFYQQVPDDVVRAMAYDKEHYELLRRFRTRSLAIVPLSARGRPLGALTLATSIDSGLVLRDADVQIAEELARRAVIAIDNSRLLVKEQQAVRIREEVLAIVSHDLKNPLGAIALSVASLLRAGADARARSQLAVIERAVQRMQHLIRDLLDMASIEAGRLAIEPRPVDASSLLRDAFDLHAALAHEKHVELTLESSAEGFTVLCDRERTIQVLSNVIGNAIKFCREGDTIELGAEVDGGLLRVSITDSGPGIAAQDLPRLFDPYWSARRHATKGTGLGLYISKAIVEGQGGSISATSEPGRTRFEITLPIRT